MAYAALLSLFQTLDHILVHDQYIHPPIEEKLISFQGNVTTMLGLLQDCSRSIEIKLFEIQIIDASYRIEDIIESKLSSINLSIYMNKAQSSKKISSEIETRWGGLHKATRDIELILKRVINTGGTSSPEDDESSKKIRSIGNILKTLCFCSINSCTHTFQPPLVALSIQPPVLKVENNSPEESECANTRVGFDSDYVAIKDRMYQNSSEFKLIPIVGMGGIGKTTLARRLYEDSIRMQYFDRCVWVVVSQDYSLKEILLGVLRSIKKPHDDLSNNNVNKLVELIHKELFGKRYLIVLDDVWSEKALDGLSRIMPKNDNGSCVLLTTRLSKVATYVTSASVYELHLLSEDESWLLLKQCVFGANCIPSELEVIGKKIGQECRGLPLTIVVVAGLLKGNMTKEYWGSISQNISSREPTIELRCGKILSLSYDHLPLHLKPCFLYVTAFPEDSEINANRLFRLWMAEGFVKSSGLKCLEEVAEEYLEDLVGRSILQASKRRYNGRIKTIGIHDLLRDVGVLKAREERFIHHGHPGTILGKQHPRRLSIHDEKSLDFLRGIRNSTTRSLLIFFSKKYEPRIPISNFTGLRVVDALTSVLVKINTGRLFHLRYLAFTNSNLRCKLVKSRFKLPNLQTLIIVGNPLSSVPHEIWTMPSLRHLFLPGESYLEQPKCKNEVFQETNLVTLSVTLSLEMNRRATKTFANLKKLGRRYTGVDQQDWKNSQFCNIVHLHKLEELKLIFALQWATPSVSPIAEAELDFPLTLKKLSLFNTRRRWRDISIVGSLPNLEVLKLRGKVFTDREWNPNDGQFLKLKYLEFVDVPLRHWGVESSHFPSLEILFLQIMSRQVERLEVIPRNLGEIDTLRLIQLVICSRSLVDSAMQIQADQREMGNENLQVIVSNIWPNRNIPGNH